MILQYKYISVVLSIWFKLLGRGQTFTAAAWLLNMSFVAHKVDFYELQAVVIKCQIWQNSGCHAYYWNTTIIKSCSLVLFCCQGGDFTTSDLDQLQEEHFNHIFKPLFYRWVFFLLLFINTTILYQSGILMVLLSIF